MDRTTTIRPSIFLAALSEPSLASGMPFGLFARFQEGDQVGQFLMGQLLVEAGGHDRDGAGADFVDLAAGDAGLLIDAGRQAQLVGRLAAEQAVVDLAVIRGDGDRLEAAHQAGAREYDRLEQVAIGSNRADLRQVRADVSAAIADGVARVASGFFAVEDKLAAADVAGGQGGQAAARAGPFAWRHRR